MITVTDIWTAKNGSYDEVWAAVRSIKNAPEGFRQVRELSPSWELFQEYRGLQARGEWGKEAFDDRYVPRFLEEMKGPAARKMLDVLISKGSQGKHVCICCFCKDERLCHRSILAGILQGKTEVCGMSADYGYYGMRYWGAGQKIDDSSMEEGSSIMVTVTLTKGEVNRIILVLSVNLDTNLVPGMMEAGEKGLAGKVQCLSDAIAKDKTLIAKLLECL